MTSQQDQKAQVVVPVFEETAAPGVWHFAGWQQLEPPAEQCASLRFRFCLVDTELRVFHT